MVFFHLLDIILTAVILKAIATYMFSQRPKQVQSPIQQPHAMRSQYLGCPRLQAFRTCPTSATTPKGCPCPQAAASKPKAIPSPMQSNRISYLFKPDTDQPRRGALPGHPAVPPIPTATLTPSKPCIQRRPHSFESTGTNFILRADVPGCETRRASSHCDGWVTSDF
ncbi:hypothetical protein BJ741DRAFT_380896 [Chytriomyces cf. hyalinus JEL632]|nr:hypothetical protein BJ741DRAFT_380896 [Chytriomyces cf. hyalinus JEL632]